MEKYTKRNPFGARVAPSPRQTTTKSITNSLGKRCLISFLHKVINLASIVALVAVLLVILKKRERRCGLWMCVEFSVVINYNTILGLAFTFLDLSDMYATTRQERIIEWWCLNQTHLILKLDY